MRVAVCGASGFVGSAIRLALESAGAEVVPISGVRVAPRAEVEPSSAVRQFKDDNGEAYDRLVSTLAGNDAIVNASGLAQPEGRDAAALNAANAGLPALLADAAATAGIRRLVHVSSAAVQGRRNPLDESADFEPLTPYARSKALGERVLLDSSVATPDQVVIYRATSVQGDDRAITRQLVRFAALPALPICGRGEAHIPVALVENVAAGVVVACTSTTAPPIVLHPWEGMTVRTLWEAFGARLLVPVPRLLVRACLAGLHRAGSAVPRIGAIARRLDLLSIGQRLDARALASLGYEVMANEEAYRQLAARIRAATLPSKR